MFPSTSTSLLVACMAYAASVAGQDLKALVGALSPGCQAAAGGLLTSDFGTCANIMQLVPAFGSNGSALAPFTAWVDSICTAPPCSPATVKTATSTVGDGCGPDAQKGVAAAVGLQSIVSNYSAIRDTLCLQYISNHTRCSTSMLETFEKAGGKPLTIVEVEGFLTTGFAAIAPLIGLAPKGAICNDCGHALFTALSASNLAGSAANTTALANATNTVGGGPQAAATSGITAICGASFADGKVPNTVSGPNGASIGNKNGTAAGASTSAGTSVRSNSVACLVIVVVFALFL